MFLHWYFLIAPKKILQVWRNFLFFGWHFFSVGLLVRTLFAPWKRESVKHRNGPNLKLFLEALIINIFTRCLGALVRLVIIILGLVFELIILFLGLLFFIGWLLFPFISLTGLIWSIKLLNC